MTKAEYEMLLGDMQSCVADRAHDENHVLRVLSNALQIAREEPQADLDILMAACLLHDVARREEMETPGVRHAEAGAGKARAFLQRQGFSAEFCSRVADCIAAHSFGSGPAPARIEEKILFDADKLDAAGALELLPDGSAILTDLSKYNAKTGLALNVETGYGLFV